LKPTLQALRGAKRVSPGAIRRYLDAHVFPLSEPGKVTFVYHGDADSVYLQHWVHGLPGGLHLQRLEHTDLWFLELDIPDGSRIEYKLEVLSGGSSEWINDPLNPHQAGDPFGANSVCWAWGYQAPDWVTPDSSARAGGIEEVTVATSDGGNRPLRVYLPARFRRTRRYPLLVVHDGGDFLRFGDLQAVLDNLIHRLDIPEMLVALDEPHERTSTYVGSEDHASYLSLDLLRAMTAEFPLIDSPAARGLLGASLGAVASLHAAWRYPGCWGRLALLSGSFAFTDIGVHQRDPVFDPVVEFVNAFRQQPGELAERIYVSCGMYESLIYENRSLVPLLQAHGAAVRYRESRDGHHWQNWRDRLRECLGWLYPGPAWMVYD
jgi:enterochelin esterase family protein